MSSFTYNPEEEVLKEHAMATATSSYTKWEDDWASDSNGAFSEMGIRPQDILL
jgi:hypothetical protein